MSMVGFPLLLIPLAIYNIIVFLMPGVSFAEPLVKLTLMSGAEWPVTLSDMLLALGILLLLLEVIKGARPGAKYLTDHLLSLIVFGAAAAEFVLWPRFGTSTYFLLTLLALVDFLSGIALRARRGVPVAAARRGLQARGARQPTAGGRAAIRSGAGARAVCAAGGLGRRIRAARIIPSRNCAACGTPTRLAEVASPSRSPEVPSPEAAAAAESASPPLAGNAPPR